ncbi:unnamed protein product, partial [Meganyctiphanes norvegica]
MLLEDEHPGDGEDSEDGDTAAMVAEVPRNFKEAIESIDAGKWHAAMKSQLDSLEENYTFQIVARPKYRKVVSSRWVFSIKPGIIDEEQYKARMVAKGYAQGTDIVGGDVRMEISSKYLNSPLNKLLIPLLT